jgi:hypothetical protein
MKKADTSDEKFQQEALSALVKYDSVVYTDGSKMSEVVGYSIVNENQTFGKRIDKMCSVYTAEARANFDACLILRTIATDEWL